MTTARLAYLTSPSPSRYVLNIQPAGEEGCQRFEISRAHLSNILIDGVALALRETCSTRVPVTASPEESRNERSIGSPSQ
jgi:hypothetical protein